MIGILFALSASFSWGAGDFCGGFATRKFHPFQVLLLTSASSLFLLILFSVLGAEHLPSTRDLILALLAGISGALGLAALYRGLSFGASALVAPVAGVIGAIIPTLVGIVIEGIPGFLTMTGFILAILGIGLISRAQAEAMPKTQGGLGLAIFAGIGFGGFLALIAQIEVEQIFTPLVFSKLASLALALILIRTRRLSIPNPSSAPIALLSGFLDAGGNILYLYAAQFARLDIAALLSSLYPAVTVLLSGLILRERITSSQWLGAGTCIAAIMLISVG